MSSSSLSPDGNNVIIEPKGDVVTISFVTNNTTHGWDYRIASGSSWIDSEKSGNRVTLTFAANESGASRSGSITFTLGDNSRTITLTQEAIDFSFTFTTLSPYFDNGVISFPTKGGSITFEFSGGTSGYDWAFELESGSDWITATRDGDNITLTTDANETDETRSTTLTFTFGTKSETINISQEAIDFNFSITSTSPYFDNGAILLPVEGGNLTLLFTPVTSDLLWSVDNPSGGDWLTVEKLDDSIEVTAIENAPLISRSVIITITHGTRSQEITITQEEFEVINVENYQETVNGVTFEMIGVVGGSFMMGDDANESDERPAHQVILSSYYIGKFVVTQKLWVAVMGSNPSGFTGDENRPVETVSWDDAQEFITELNRLTGKTYSLPTEAQWEYAARGGTMSQNYKYSGSNYIGDVAWYASNSSNITYPVGSKTPNELGIYDMSGNVWEWCSDWYDSSYYYSSPLFNPTGPDDGDTRARRGGSWLNSEGGHRCANRADTDPDRSTNAVGFRLVRIAD